MGTKGGCFLVGNNLSPFTFVREFILDRCASAFAFALQFLSLCYLKENIWI